MINDNGGRSSTDPWAGWAPVWGKKKEIIVQQQPHDYQEKHSPTKKVFVRQRSTRTMQKCNRRMVDARLWDGMSPTQQDAAVQIVQAYETLNTGLGYATSNWEKIPGGGRGNLAEVHARRVNNYIDWTKRCFKEKVSHSMIIDILVFNHSLSATDKARRVRKGRSRKNLLDGLSLYCALQGWPAS